MLEDCIQKGGGCNVCGDVTHLKKDCPSYQAQQKRDDNLNIGMLGDNNPDVLNPNNDYDQKSVYKRPNKVIKF
ncbi:hypothetical protein NQ317_005554 [Molorchus minor]|uniref:CCHC-type domain-containing protein n=1 Tax=Molorchus minor TaxID=1323400 RepID=A0ABQ9JYZ6_9CUCU|nr:hypothetical protein NQ317_005554 [Molorchus minor]